MKRINARVGAGQGVGEEVDKGQAGVKGELGERAAERGSCH